MTFLKDRHISSVLAAIAMFAVMLMSASCQSASDEPDAPEAKRMMGLYVNLGGIGNEALTRAEVATADYYESGSGLENYIDPDDVEVYLFTTDGKLISPLTSLSSLTEFEITPPADPEGGRVVCQMFFRVDKILPQEVLDNFSFKIVMLANWGRYPSINDLEPGITTIEDLTANEAAIGNFAPQALSKNHKIPFFGVQQFDNVKFTTKKTISTTRHLNLLRAWAKIEVMDHVESYEPIEKVILTRYNSKFYKAPLGVSQSNDYTLNDLPRNIERVSLPSENPYMWELSSEPITLEKDENGHFVTYVPEYRNTGRQADQATLTIVYSNNRTYTAEFKYYNNPPVGSQTGDAYDICRNYWYKFIIKKKGLSDVIINADVIPYSEKELKPEFGLDPDDYNKPTD